ncbi:hypothetical protein BH09PAT2_BH09PAT2_09970 [soil metagenome]
MKLIHSKSSNYVGLAIAWIIFLYAIFFQPINKNILTPIAQIFKPLQSLSANQVKDKPREVFGFLPYWNFKNTDNIDYEALTTLAYFDVKMDPSGNLIKNDAGYESFTSDKATQIFRTAHKNGVRVVLTLTMMDNENIKALLGDSGAKQQAIEQAVQLVQKRGIDGINIDIEYDGDAGDEYRHKFTQFAEHLTTQMHAQVPASKVTVSVYASGARYPKVQNIAEVARVTDGIFMMGYDFAVASSEVAMPTAPLGGYKEGKYWYDILTAVDDFLAVMPPNKLILGTPWYGLNFEVYEPSFKAETVSSYYWGRKGLLQTYKSVKESVHANRTDATVYKTGWDEVGQVGWKAYYTPASGTWRMVYMDDPRSLGAKYDLAKNKHLLGVGIWAIGFEGDSTEMWDMLRQKFGTKIADIRISQKPIYELL